jgi:hypothetical protein
LVCQRRSWNCRIRRSWFEHDRSNPRVRNVREYRCWWSGSRFWTWIEILNIIDLDAFGFW